MSTSSTIALKRRIQERAGTSLASWSTNSHNIMRNLKGSRSNFIDPDKGTQVLLVLEDYNSAGQSNLHITAIYIELRDYFSLLSTRYV